MRPMHPLPWSDDVKFKCNGGHVWPRLYDALRCCNGYILAPTRDQDRIDAVHTIMVTEDGKPPSFRPQYLSWRKIEEIQPAEPAKAVA